MKAPRIDIYPSRDGKYQYQIVAGNGEPVGPHEIYTTPGSAKRGAVTLLRVLVQAIFMQRFNYLEGK